MSFQTKENVTFVQEQLGLTVDNINIIQDALTKAQATCEATDEQRIKNAIDIVNKASGELGTPNRVPALVASEGESSTSDTTSENDSENRSDTEAKKKRLKKRKNKKKT